MDWDDRRGIIQGTFTPAKPVRNQELFAGRTAQLIRVIDTFSSPGEHAAIFGERGVGKTSLASVSDTAAGLSGRFPIRINCLANDTASDIWARIGTTMTRKVRVDAVHRPEQVSGMEEVVAASASLLIGSHLTESDVLTALELLAETRPVVLFLDEFDRIGESHVHTAVVDMMKTVADNDVDVTFVVVGVAGTVDGLIEEHGSIGRGLNEIEMPRMSTTELIDILDRGLAQAEMAIQDDAASFVARLSMGLPHYAHLMGLHAAINAIAHYEEVVTVEHIELALPLALERAEQHVRQLYYDATHSTQTNIYREVLLAAALTKPDDRGYFAPGDLRAPLGAILGRRIEIPSFNRHLGQFVDQRGPVLEKSQQLSRPRYRFTEPLLVPFVAMRGVSEGIIEREALRGLISDPS